MIEKVTDRNKAVIVNILAVILATVIAIILHAVMPADVNTENLDSVLVKLLGFPAISVFYFVLLFIHCAIVLRYFGKQSKVSKLQIGFRFGLAFAILYLFGMQEIVLETSSFKEWGCAFVSYQFFMGVGDAIPVLLLCGAAAYFALNNANTSIPVKALSRTEKSKIVSLITTAFLTERAIGYETGIIMSSCNEYPIPCYIWTILFGIMLGCSYLILYPVFAKKPNKVLFSFKLAILTIGVNWIIFNCFIGLIFSGMIPQVFLRSGIDVTILFLSSIVISKYFVKNKGDETWNTEQMLYGSGNPLPF